MPWAPMHNCARAGCRRLTDSRFCDQCKGPHERERLQAEPWRRWYQTAEWRALRMRVLTRDGFRCQCVDCQGRYVWPLATIADHKVPHRGHAADFWNEDGIQALTTVCHNRKTAREVNARRGMR